MEIEGPLKFRIISYDDSLDREIHIDFKEEFQNLELQEQVSSFAHHISLLQSQASALKQDDQERQGMLVALQFIEELAPYIQTGEIPLNETIVFKVQAESPLNKLISSLKLN